MSGRDRWQTLRRTGAIAVPVGALRCTGSCWSVAGPTPTSCSGSGRPSGPTPRTRDRVLLAFGEPAATWVRRLDWLAWFRIAREGSGATAPAAQASAQGATVVDGDGLVRAGSEARWLVLSRPPLTFPVGAPGLALQRLRARAADRRSEART